MLWKSQIWLKRQKLQLFRAATAQKTTVFPFQGRKFYKFTKTIWTHLQTALHTNMQKTNMQKIDPHE